jgi:phosphatidylglycerophosphatase A
VNGWATQLATCFGIGRLPLAPGTWASAAALPFGWLLCYFQWPVIAGAALLAAVVGIWSCGAHARATANPDPPECVMDEVAGQWLTLVPIAIEGGTSDWRALAMAFFLFRLFDMLKPWPISQVQHWPGGLGIVMDDIFAGTVAAVLLYGFLLITLV